jgi:Aspartyl protease
MSRHIFPYGIRFREDRHIELFPAAELLMKGRRTQGIRAVFHIDSGATVSVLPSSDAKALGLPLRSGKKTVVRGIGGEPLIGYQHMIAVHLDEEKIKMPVVFVDHDRLPRILGRDGVFGRFAVMFDEARRRVSFIDAEKERTMIDHLFSAK